MQSHNETRYFVLNESIPELHTYITEPMYDENPSLASYESTLGVPSPIEEDVLIFDGKQLSIFSPLKDNMFGDLRDFSNVSLRHNAKNDLTFINDQIAFGRIREITHDQFEDIYKEATRPYYAKIEFIDNQTHESKTYLYDNIGDYFLAQQNMDDFKIQYSATEISENEYINLKQGITPKPHLRLYIDMDGTLAVFSPVDHLEALYEKGYFENLKPQRNVVEAVKEIIKRNPDIEVNILSAYLSDSPYALAEKNAWLNRYLPEITTKNRVFLPCGQDKKDYVENLRETDFLLDDYTENLNAWEPPARGIKLLTDINNTHGSWASDRIRYDKPPDEIAKDIVLVMLDEEHVMDESPETRESIDRRRNNLFQRLFAQGIEKDVVLNAFNQGEFSNGYLDDSKDFHLLGRDDVTSVAVFSDPENLLSHASINELSGQDYTDTDRIAPTGNKFEALTRYLDDNPNINNIIICTNNNKTCQIEAEQLKNKLIKAGYVPENGYHCERQLPTGQKNFNDCLKELRQQGAERCEEYELE